MTADGFFRRSRIKGEEEEVPTIESVAEAITLLKAELAAREEELAALQKQAEHGGNEGRARARGGKRKTKDEDGGEQTKGARAAPRVHPL
jgi:hypothetical protein